MSSPSVGPTVAARTRAKTICGNEIKTSIVRISRSSSLPREYAAVSPTPMPRVTPIAVESAGQQRTETPPSRKRLKVSRPRVSVPNLASLDGWGERELSLDALIGRYGVTNRPNTAMPTISSVIPSPIFVRCCFQAAEKRTRSGAATRPFELDLDCVGDGDVVTGRDVLQARADDDRRDVGEEVQHDVQRRDEERDRLDGRHVTRADRLHEEEPDARVVEHRLDHHDASGQVGEVERRHLERRRECVRHRVAPEDTPLGEPLEPCHLTKSLSRISTVEARMIPTVYGTTAMMSVTTGRTSSFGYSHGLDPGSVTITLGSSGRPSSRRSPRG